MRLLIDDTFATKTYTTPISSGGLQAQHGLEPLLVARLTANQITPEDAALIPSSELSTLHATHDVIPGIAVIADGVGAIAMRTPVRPDEIDTTPVRLLDAGGTAELLARATLQPFYGITPVGWIREDEAPAAARAEVVIVDGPEALREPEAGFSEDLARAWFILTAQPVISHILVAPRDLPAEDTAQLAPFLAEARAIGIERRRDWRPQLSDREGVGRDRASAFWAAQRLTLEAEDRRALLDLLARGSQGTSGFSPSNVRFVEGTGAV
jgi:predicted solute-binding protein